MQITNMSDHQQSNDVPLQETTYFPYPQSQEINQTTIVYDIPPYPQQIVHGHIPAYPQQPMFYAKNIFTAEDNMKTLLLIFGEEWKGIDFLTNTAQIDFYLIN